MKGRMSPAAVSVSAFQAENMGATAEVPPRMSCLPPSMIVYPLLGSDKGPPKEQSMS